LPKILTLLYIVTLVVSCDSTEFASGVGKNSSAENNSEIENTNTVPTESEESQDYQGFFGDGDSNSSGTAGVFDIQHGELCTSVSGDSSHNKATTDLKGTNIFFENFAVDPGNTSQDPSAAHGLTPYPVSASDKLSTSVFKFSKKDLNNLVDGSIEKIEWIVFAHQFNLGLDTIEIELTTIDGKISSKLTPNIYSAYGIATIDNIVVSGDSVKGDVLLSTFSYDPNSSAPHNAAITTLGNVSSQVGTAFVGPASEKISADVEKMGVDLTDFSLTISIGADSYDSVQYRTIEGMVWGKKTLSTCD
jgi:hypothetical protein